MANKDFKIKNGLDIQSPLPVSMGGTGQTTTGNTLNALLPSQAGNSNKFLQSDGSNVSWVANVAYQRGGTGARPGSPTVGDLYYNTDTNIFEQYTSSGWFAVAAAPSAPTSVVATNQGSGRAYNNGQASVAFSAGTSGGANSTFTVTPSPSTSPATFTGSSSPITVTNLASSTQYTYTVTGSSAYGTSSASSASAGVTATTVPQAPTINSVTAASQSAIITFTAGSTGGAAISQYTITSDPVTTTETTSSSPYTFTGLTDGTAYTFTMTATNSNGTSIASAPSDSVTPAPIGGSLIPLGAVNVGSAGAASVTFSSIPSTYTHLQIRAFCKCTTADSFVQSIYGQFNSDTGSNYARHFLNGSGSAVATNGFANQTSMFFGTNINATATSVFAANVIDILDYANTNKYKTTRSFSGADNNGAGFVQFMSGLWMNTAAITSITILPNADNFAQYSSFALYGIKGA